MSRSKYSLITGRITKDVFKYTKISKKRFDRYHKEIFISDGLYRTNYLDFNLRVIFVRNKNFKYSLQVDGFTDYYGTFEKDVIQVLVKINPRKEPFIYEELHCRIQNTIRHELEHLTQSGYNRKSNKAKPTDLECREQIAKTNSYLYFMLPDEVPAMIHGIHREAKIRKISVIFIMKNYLNYFIEINRITPYQKSKILKIWKKAALELNVPLYFKLED